ncbi:hypothetical protein [Salinactinospora qingdaonensis]|uniref:Uncharacterized protein n=1 Tax=Salinactinospora qingdaonensis TaxID=702744 RepID=A0ABP7G5J8_9ACTN
MPTLRRIAAVVATTSASLAGAAFLASSAHASGGLLGPLSGILSDRRVKTDVTGVDWSR